MKKSKYKHAIKACLENSDRLLEDAQTLEFSNPPATAFALAIIAQEELAKGFLLALIEKGIIPWNELIWRAARDHKCKHLMVMVMDFLNPEWDEFLARDQAWYAKILDGQLPRPIADAMNIFCHEKIRRWESSNWFWAEPPDYESKAKKVGDGLIDKWKQDQLYVQIGKGGSASVRRVVSQKQYEEERDRAHRLSSVVQNMLKEERAEQYDYKLVTDAFKMLFQSIGPAPRDGR